MWGSACPCGGSRPSCQRADGWILSRSGGMRTREDVTQDRLLNAFLAASVVVVLVGWATALVYLGFRFL
jgi:hypothetical protein